MNKPQHERVDSSHSKTSETWEKFEVELDNQDTPTSAGTTLEQQVLAEVGFDTSDTPPPPANGVVEQHDRSPTPTKVKPVASWEKFEEAPKVMQKKISASHGEHGAVCAADAMVSDLQWTALDDSAPTEFLEESYDPNNLPFRKTQSMRTTTNRKVQIVDALKQRRPPATFNQYCIALASTTDTAICSSCLESLQQLHTQMSHLKDTVMSHSKTCQPWGHPPSPHPPANTTLCSYHHHFDDEAVSAQLQSQEKT